MKLYACIEASPEKTWSVLAALENLSQWSEPVLSSKYVGEQRKGVGTQRVCELSNSVTITEKWVDWVEGVTYTYEGFNLPLVKFAKNKWSVKSENGKTLLSTESEVVLKGGILGRLLEPIMLIISNKMGADALAAFKYLVENDKPYEGKHSSLPRVSGVC
ncbi:SRPBCC family protein [Alteromonadaceae bacterium M269]|nr:SRPBCC family protein [Alteromonadaceae bacterium M269]